MKKSPWIKDTRPKLVYLNTWSINHIIFRTTWKREEKYNEHLWQTPNTLLSPTFSCKQQHMTLALVPGPQTDTAPPSASTLMTCTDAALAYCPFSAKRINWARDAVVEADHVIMFVQCSSSAVPAPAQKTHTTQHHSSPNHPLKKQHSQPISWMICSGQQDSRPHVLNEKWQTWLSGLTVNVTFLSWYSI